MRDFCKPDDLIPIARRTRQHCKSLYKECLKSTSKVQLLSLMDEISNNLCSIMDLAVCIRQTHPSLHFKRVASKCLQFMQPQLILMNTSGELFETFKELPLESDNQELIRMNKQFLCDFEMAGLAVGKVDQVVQLSQRADYLLRILERGKDDSVGTLVALLRVRHQLANILDFDSFAQMTLKNSWFRTVENVIAYLQSVGKDANLVKVDIKEEEVPCYSFEQLMDGFGKLIKEHLNLTIKIVPCYFDWSFGLICLDIYCNSTNTLLGSIYFDPYGRNNKPSQASHYTIRGSKSIQCTNMVHSIDNSPQRPQSFVSASFEKGQNIDFFTAQTIMHEFGHALHSVLSRTMYQTLSGTRCHLEAAEFPSTVMEHLFENKEIQQRFFGLNYSNEEFFEKLKIIRVIHQRQVGLLSIIDLQLHSRVPDNIDEVERTIKSVYDGDISNVQLKHLATYGSSFYTYSLANQLSESILNSTPNPWPSYQRLLHLGGLLDVETIKSSAPDRTVRLVKC